MHDNATNRDEQRARERQELLDAIDRLSIDTIERLKYRNQQHTDDDDHHHSQSLCSSIQCLPTGEMTNGMCLIQVISRVRLGWEYSDWSYTMDPASKEANGDGLPMGVCSLEDDVAQQHSTSAFRRERENIEKMTAAAKQFGDASKLNVISRLLFIVKDDESTSSNRDDEYMTMKPIASRNNRRQPPPNTDESQRRPLLVDDAGSYSDSDDGGGTF